MGKSPFLPSLDAIRRLQSSNHSQNVCNDIGIKIAEIVLDRAVTWLEKYANNVFVGVVEKVHFCIAQVLQEGYRALMVAEISVITWESKDLGFILSGASM